MPKYSVKVDGKTVWKGEGDDYKVIPAEYRARPGDGEPAHVLIEDGETIGVQRSENDEAAAAGSEG
jgi:hypothetical protein